MLTWNSFRRFFTRSPQPEEDEAAAASGAASSDGEQREKGAQSSQPPANATAAAKQPQPATPKQPPPKQRSSLASLWGGGGSEKPPNNSDPASSGRVRHERFNCGYAERQGRRPTMQDITIVKPDFGKINDKRYALFALFDGHGGQAAAKLCGDVFGDVLTSKLKSSAHVVRALKESYLEVNSQIAQASIQDGTCALCAVIVTSDTGDASLYVANAGDSEAVLARGGKPKAIAAVHRPKMPGEISRITSGGGFVTARGRVNGVLAVSRALGDIALQPHVSPEPEITETSLGAGDGFLVIACDGVWDVVSKEQACSIVSGCLKSEQDPERAAILLRDKAFSMGSTDNISVIVVRFVPHTQATPGRPPVASPPSAKKPPDSELVIRNGRSASAGPPAPRRESMPNLR